MAARLAQNFPGVSVYLGAKNAMTTILIRFRFIIVEQKLFNQKSRQTLLELTFPARNSKELNFQFILMNRVLKPQQHGPHGDRLEMQTAERPPGPYYGPLVNK